MQEEPKQWERRIAVPGPGAASTEQTETVASVRRWQRRNTQFHYGEGGVQDRTKGLQGAGNGCCISKNEPLFILLRARVPSEHSFSKRLGCLIRENAEAGLGVGGRWKVGSEGQREEPKSSAGSGPDCRQWSAVQEAK